MIDKGNYAPENPKILGNLARIYDYKKANIICFLINFLLSITLDPNEITQEI